MHRPKVVIARPIPVEVESYISKHCEIVQWEGDGRITRDRFFAALAEAEGLLTSFNPIDATLLDHAPKLRIVSNISVGYNNFDLPEMKRRGVIGTNTPGVLDDTVADLIVALMLAAARRIPELDRTVRGGGWRKGMDAELYGIDVHHKTVGIIGMGRIGEATAKRLRFGFDMKVIYYNRNRNEEIERHYEAEYRTMEQLLAESDYVVVMTPLTPKTVKLIGAAQFALMKRTAIFINASRGQVVDEAALIEALRCGQIRAAGLDVYEQEPIAADNPMLGMPNVVLLPHIGSATAQTRADMAMLAARNLVAGVLGQKPPNVAPELVI